MSSPSVALEKPPSATNRSDGRVHRHQAALEYRPGLATDSAQRVVDDVGWSDAALEQGVPERRNGLGRPDVAERPDGRHPHLRPAIREAVEQCRHRAGCADLPQRLTRERPPPW